MANPLRPAALLSAALLSCGHHNESLDSLEDGPLPPALSASVEEAPPAAERLEKRAGFLAFQDELAAAYQSWPERRAALMMDKPLYRPGETIWVSTWDLRSRDLSGDGAAGSIELHLINPKGALVTAKTLSQSAGEAWNDFAIEPSAPGGRYLIRAVRGGETLAERPVIVNRYEPPRLKKKLEFVRKAYGVGDEVTATVEVRRAGGEPLAEQTLTAQISLDGGALEPVSFRTNAGGEGLVRFRLPDAIELGDGLLTVLVEDGGVTESVSKRVPIVLDRLDMALYPEGGDLVAGLPARVYLEARSPLGKPADVEGRVVDDRGSEVATFQSLRDGRGRFSFTPEPGRAYRAEVTKPEGIAQTFALPKPRKEGCALRSYDDFEGELPAIRVGIRCTSVREVDVQAVLRGNLIDGASVAVAEGEEAVVYLSSGDPGLDQAQGVARITVFDGREPLAERLVYRGRRSSLKVEVTPDKERYGPREKVTLSVKTSTPDGRPVPARLSMSVVDDTVIALADDKEGHLLSQLYLEGELPEPVEEPNWYFDLDKPEAAEAMDHLMGTRGWRRFDWALALAPPPPPVVEPVFWDEGMEMRDFDLVGGLPAPMAMPEKEERGPPPEAPAPEALKVDDMPEELLEPMDAPALIARPAVEDMDLRALGYLAEGRANIAGDANWDEFEPVDRKQVAQWAPARVFPAPVYDQPYDGPRVDFRETLHWAPDLDVPESGEATISFYTSDAITSFRVFTQGVGAGFAGRDEAVITSSLPFSMGIKLPVAVSEGDILDLPLTFTNETDRRLSVGLRAEFSDLLKVLGGAGGEIELDPGERESRDFSLEVVGKQGLAAVRFAADASGLKDAFTRDLTVSPLGFPMAWEAAGEISGEESFTVDLGQSIPGTVSARVQLYPSPLSTLVEGMEGLLREPSGCFEQTSSSNYPNVMVLRYLEEQDAQIDPRILENSRGLLERGYGKLVGFETPERGYEWFGSTPAHEALSAYGLVEFVDMQSVFPGVDGEMIRRTRTYLLSRRDGEGGYLRDAKALDSFGQASSEITDAYITWSLIEAGEPASSLPAELARARSVAAESQDAYLLALSANTLLKADRPAGEAAVARLLRLQAGDGSWTGTTHSITRSTGLNLQIESTALAVTALMLEGRHPTELRGAVQWLNEHRSGFGQWGSTQATVLTLRALTDYARASKVTRGAGQVEVLVNGEVVAQLRYAAGHQGTIDLSDFGASLKPGINTLTVRHQGEALPFSAAVEYRSLLPATHPEVAVGLSTELAKSELGMGETVRLTATLRNLTREGQPMTVARIGLPGGLAAQGWQLEELRESGAVDFYETGAREVVVYFRELAPEAEKTIPLDLVAEIPGRFTAPASSAWLYYSNDKKSWAPGTEVRIQR